MSKQINKEYPNSQSDGLHQDAVPRNEAGQVLNFDRLVAAARQEAEFSDFGDEDIFITLKQVLQFATNDLTFRPAGLGFVEEYLRRSLVNRLRYRRDLILHPEILDEDVSDPLIITGLPRTGTTKLHRLLSVDPNSQPLWLWRVLNPARVRTSSAEDIENRIQLAQAYQEHMGLFDSSHETRANIAEEDSLILLQALDYFQAVVFIPSQNLLRWLRGRPRETAYHYEKKMLQYLQWQDGGKRGRRWVLKNPGHLGNLDVVADIFPKAQIIYTQRDIEYVIGSYCFLIHAMWNASVIGISAEDIGRHAIEFWSPEQNRFNATRPNVEKRLRFLEVSYKKVTEDPFSTIDEIYDFSGLHLTPEAKAAMMKWNENNKQHKLGKPEYVLSDYGLSGDMLRKIFY